MTHVSREHLRQRADYTHKYNLHTGRHGWVRLTPAFSVKIVDEILAGVDQPVRVLDPFCGTATTALSATYRGHHAATTDINPFLVWLGRAKTDHYSPRAIGSAKEACTVALSLVKQGKIKPSSSPQIHNIDRWWPVKSLVFLQVLRAAIDEVTSPGSQERTLLNVAFCRSLIKLSNAAFNHQSMSFRDDAQLEFDIEVDKAALFRDDVRFILEGAADNPTGSCTIIEGDSRDLPALLDGHFDLLITSPPYANRMSYIRELRPYMYWLGFVLNGRDAGELDWSSIGGTWGIATSRLLDWKRPSAHFKSDLLDTALSGIMHDDNKSGRILANYVAKYFDDMWSHVQGLPAVLSSGAEIHYIVGNSTFYGVLLPVEQIYAAMFEELGFTEIRCRPVRKRNSKKELFEFDVTARWTDKGERNA